MMDNSLLQPESNQCQYCCGKALESGNFGEANEELNEGISLLTNRQKMIKLADKSEFCFPSVQEHVCDDLADDEADAAKMKKAEKRTAAESKFFARQEEKVKPQIFDFFAFDSNSTFRSPSRFFLLLLVISLRPPRSIFWKLLQRLRFVFSMWKERPLGQFLPL